MNEYEKRVEQRCGTSQEAIYMLRMGPFEWLQIPIELGRRVRVSG